MPRPRIAPAVGAIYLGLDAVACWLFLGWANTLAFEAMVWAHCALYLVRGCVALVVLGRDRVTQLFSKPLREIRWSIVIVGTGAAACAAAALIALAALFFVGIRPGPALDVATSVGGAWLGSLVITGILAPVVEELIDRAVLIELMPGWAPGWLAVAASAFVFGFMHAVAYRQGGVPVFPAIGGALTAIAFLMRGSLIAPISVHAGGNLFLAGLETLAGNVTVLG